MSNQDSGLWKRGIFLLILVGVIAGVALVVALRRTANLSSQDAPICPDLLAPTLCSPFARFPGSVNWGFLQHASENLPSAKGWEVRYNATLALARRGHPDLPFEVMLEMLDERQQMLNFSVCQKDGRWTPNVALARRAVYNALQAFVRWHKDPQTPKKFEAGDADLKKEYQAKLEKIYQEIDQLTQSANDTIRTEATKALKIMERD